MITIEVNKYKHPDLVGKWTFYKNTLSIGSSDSDVFLFDQKIEQDIILKISDNFLEIFLPPNVTTWHLNQKKATQTKRIKKNDTISLLDLTFTIVDFNSDISGDKTTPSPFSVYSDETISKILEILSPREN